MRHGLLIIFIFAFLSLVVAAEGENLVKNGSFEQINSGLPTQWSFAEGDGRIVKAYNDAAGGNNSLYICNKNKMDTMVKQEVTLNKDKLYKVSARVKAKTAEQAGSANITLYYVSNSHGTKGIYTSKELMNTDGNWENIEFTISPRNDIDDPITIAARLGGQGSANSGEAWFDDISITETKDINPTAHFDFNQHKPAENKDSKSKAADNNTNTTKPESAGNSNNVILIIGAMVMVGAIVLFNKKKNAEEEESDEEDDESDEEDK